MPPVMNPPEFTPARVILRLKSGHSVGLDEPGWGDTYRTFCPDCQRAVMTFRVQPTLLYEYGVAYAHPHRCGEVIPLEEHPKWLKLQALEREIDQLRQQNDNDLTRRDRT